MRIEVVTDTFAPDINGVAMTLGRLVGGLRKRGHFVHVLHTGAANDSDESRAWSFPLPGYREVRVGLPKPIELRARWSRERPDVIYVATESPLGKSALKSAAALGIPAASGFHTNFHEFITRYGLPRFESLAMAYLRRFHQRACCTFTPSVEMAKQLAEEGIRNVQWLGRGVDTRLFDPAKRCEALRSSWGVRAATPVAIVVGRVSAEKNLDLAVEAFEAIRAAVPDTACMVVGNGPLRATLQRSHPWIHFAGVRTGEDLARHYASADVMLFPSETETFGNVLLEGLASGLATVSFRYAASALHVRHGENGLQAERGDRAGFILQSVDALRHPREGELRHAARATAEPLSWDSVVDRFESVLTGLVDVPADSPADRRPATRGKLSFRTVFLSDLHLGSVGCKADEVVSFLKSLRCEKLVLNGDIIDAWALRRGSRWLPQHTRVIRRILKMSERDDTEVIYLRGNHDDVIERILPLVLGKIRLAREHIHSAVDGSRYLVVHGDGFDSVSTRHKWIAVAGAFGYDFLLGVNRLYNRWRAWRGRDYYSLSQAVKARVKSAVCFIDRYEELLQQLARRKGCSGIICGHIHTPEDKTVGGIHYLNSGDWVESLTAIIEHHDGRFELVRYGENRPGSPGGGRPDSSLASVGTRP